MMEAGHEQMLPLGTVDTHFHLFGPPSLYPYTAGRGYTPDDAGLDAYVAMAGSLGISRAVIVQPSPYGTDNHRLLDGLAASPIPMRGVVAIESDISDNSLDEMHKAGVRGIRINLVFDAAAAVRTAEDLAPRLKDLGWHVQFLVDVSTWHDLAKTVDLLNVPVVFDHMGHVPTWRGTANPGFQAMLALVREGRAWVKTSGAYRMVEKDTDAPYDQVRPFFDAVLEANPDRVLWATDWPHSAIQVEMPSDLTMAETAMRWLGSDENLRQRLFVQNAVHLYGFSSDG